MTAFFLMGLDGPVLIGREKRTLLMMMKQLLTLKLVARPAAFSFIVPVPGRQGEAAKGRHHWYRLSQLSLCWCFTRWPRTRRAQNLQDRY